MADVLMIAGQILSVCGLAYGWYLSLLFSVGAGKGSKARERVVLLHHLAMA